MANLNENPSWDSVPRTERTTKWLGANDQTGEIGTANLAPQALANRTIWLKQQLEGHGSATDPHPQYTTAAEVTALIEARVGDYVMATSSGGNYVVALDPPITTYTAKTEFSFKASHTNTGGPLLNAGGGFKWLYREDGTALLAGDIVSGAVLTVVFDVATDAFRVTEIVASQVGAMIQTQKYTAFTTTGAAPAFSVAAAPGIAAYVAGLRLRLKFNAAGNGADTINVNALGAKSLKQYDATGAKVAAVIAANQLVDVEYDGVDFVLLNQLPAGGTDTELLLPGADAGVGPLPVGAVMPVNGVLNTTAVTLKKGIYIYDCYGWSTQLGGGGTVGGGFVQQPVAITGIINASDTWRRINGETVNGKFYTGVLKVLTPTAQVVMQYRSHQGSTFTVPGPNSEYVSFYRIR